MEEIDDHTVRLLQLATVVPGPDARPVEIKPGDWWPAPYRGSKYTIRTIPIDGGRRRVFLWRHQNQYEREEVAVIHGNPDRPITPRGLARAMVEAGKPTGSLHVSSHGEVLSKVPTGDGRWMPKYLGRIEGAWSFPGVDMNPNPNPERMDVWPGFNFKCGEQWAVWTREGAAAYLYWSARGFYFRSIDEYPELVRAYLEIRPYGGRLYITEHGYVWMNLPKDEVSEACEASFSRKVAEFKDRTSTSEKDVLLRMVHERLGATGCWPIYLGHVSEFDGKIPPRTFYKDLTVYQDTSDPEMSDEAPFDSDYWRKMLR